MLDSDSTCFASQLHWVTRIFSWPLISVLYTWSLALLPKSFSLIAQLSTVPIWVFWPFVNHFFPRKILLPLFLIKLLFEIDSYSKLKMKKPGHSFRWLIRKKKLFSLKNDAQPYQPLILTENEMWFPEVWLTFLGMMELLSRLDFYWLSWLYSTGKTFLMWSWHQLKIIPIYLSIHFELLVIYSYPSYLINRITFFFLKKNTYIKLIIV